MQSYEHLGRHSDHAVLRCGDTDPVPVGATFPWP